jgi:hypothetical protein
VLHKTAELNRILQNPVYKAGIVRVFLMDTLLADCVVCFIGFLAIFLPHGLIPTVLFGAREFHKTSVLQERIGTALNEY